MDAEHVVILLLAPAADEWQEVACPLDSCHTGAVARRERRRRSRREVHVVCAVAGSSVAAFELGVAHEVFGLDRSELADPWYEFRVVAVGDHPIRVVDGSWSISTPYRLADLADADTIVVPAWASTNGPADPELLEALRAAHRRGARLISVCSGAFLLAEAGLLDGRRATTHWKYTDELARGYPAIDVDPEVLYVDGGDGVYTSAGTAAGIDLCLHIVRLDHGAEVANAVARRMVVPAHRDGGQAQFVAAPVPDDPDDDTLAPTLDWAIAHLDEPLTVEDLARRALMSPRTFARRFRAATGTTPLQWLLRQRIVHAQHLLEATDLPVELIASRCGFGSATALRVHFRRATGTNPLAYRRTFALAS
jgi:AraC family transcriptional regulator, transcriptional activator FtrA